MEQTKKEVANGGVSQDPLGCNYGEIPLIEVHSKSVAEWTKISLLSEKFKDESVLVRGRIHSIRAVSKKMAFVVVRETGCTVQCVLTVKKDLESVTSLNKESMVDVVGLVSVPVKPLKATTQKVEIQVTMISCVNKALPTLPFNIEDASRSELEIQQAFQAGQHLVRVNQDTRLNYRFLDLRTPANAAIFRIRHQVGKVLLHLLLIFRNFLEAEDFVEIHTPKLMGGSSEGGSAVFRLTYKGGQPACLAQSPQLHKQMTICGDFGRVFEIGPVFRAEDSSTHRHLCEFIGLDIEMEIKQHYSEVMDIVDHLFVAMFDHLKHNCQDQLEEVGKQYPFEPLEVLV